MNIVIKASGEKSVIKRKKEFKLKIIIYLLDPIGFLDIGKMSGCVYECMCICTQSLQYDGTRVYSGNFS